QSGLVINELQAANHGTVVNAEGGTPDWIEVYNAGRSPVNMRGMRVAIAGRQHVIDASLVVPSKGHVVLWCDAHPERGVDHMGFTLPRDGGTALLIAADATTIADLFTWPALSTDLSMGRTPDGAKAWSFFEQPTPGIANTVMAPVRSRATTPDADHNSGVYGAPFDLALVHPETEEIRYTLDGSVPDQEHGDRYNSPMRITTNTVLRARSYAPGKLASMEFSATYIIGGGSSEGIALIAAPGDLWSDSTGIDVDGANANHSRKGIAWERPVTVRFFGDPSTTMAAGMRISGSGSRGLAKRSFKLYARDQYGSGQKGFPFADGARLSEGILRADASPSAFLRNRLLELLVGHYQLHVDMQPSTPIPLYLNARYWGLYRWMPPKDAQWLEHISGSEAVDVLEGPAATVLSGNDATFPAAQQALLAGAPLDSINALIDTGNLIDLACIDLYTGRADHDLNVRCYRPRQAGGRWRWVLFDLDLWAPANENSVERMCSASVPETPYVPQLLAHPELQEQLLARMTALLATTFEPLHARAMADSLFHAHEPQLIADHQRWMEALDRPDPLTSVHDLDAFIAERPGYLARYLSDRTGRALRTVTVTVPGAEQGRMLLEGLPLEPGEHKIDLFRGVRTRIAFVPAAGWEFAGWKGLDSDEANTVRDLAHAKNIRPLLRAVIP
ncbi:MAG TPA: CotH kinase family protein, partial [Flavobacteriales bacterium]|nr:CotH kinase family protein [Flavobacteriales bacterium]